MEISARKLNEGSDRTTSPMFRQMLLLSQDYGKHLLGVEDLLQKHALVEADIAIQADRVRNVNSNAQKFAINIEGDNGNTSH